MINSKIDFSEIRLVSWDVDGTLFSYKRLGLQLLMSIFKKGSVDGWKKIGKNVREILNFHRRVEAQRLNTDCEVNQTQLAEFSATKAREKEALQVALGRIPPRQNALALIKTLSADGILQVALSDFECEYKLEALGLREHFHKAYSCEQMGFWKPSPIPLSRIQTEFGIRPEQHLHIGDRPATDGIACSRNGCHFLHISQLPFNFN